MESVIQYNNGQTDHHVMLENYTDRIPPGGGELTIAPTVGKVIECSWTSSTPTFNLLQPNTVQPPDTDGSLAWLGANLDQLSKQHGDKWVLVKGCTVVEESDDPLQLERSAGQQGIERPYITKIPPPSKAWRTAYSGAAIR